MSEAEQQIHDSESDGMIHRSFSAELTAGDGRTVDVRIVPYGEQITHNDGLGGVARGVPYQEEWMAGAFDHQLKAAHRVLANFEHQQTLAGVIGHGLALREEKDGLHGSFKIHDTPDGDKALVLIREGVIDGVSLEAIPRKAIRTTAGVIRRVKADLRGVAFTRHRAYAGATILAVREEPETVVDEELLPIAPNAEALARAASLGIKLPDRYEAQPDDTDTSAEADTSEDGTRQTTDQAEPEG